MPVMDAWLSAARDRIAEAAEVPSSELELSADMEATLLDLARVAAHESGARTNAPLLCYLLGRAGGSAGLEELAEAIKALPAPPAPD
jgi:hypothetical protein